MRCIVLYEPNDILEQRFLNLTIKVGWSRFEYKRWTKLHRTFYIVLLISTLWKVNMKVKVNWESYFIIISDFIFCLRYKQEIIKFEHCFLTRLAWKNHGNIILRYIKLKNGTIKETLKLKILYRLVRSIIKKKVFRENSFSTTSNYSCTSWILDERDIEYLVPFK